MKRQVLPLLLLIAEALFPVYVSGWASCLGSVAAEVHRVAWTRHPYDSEATTAPHPNRMYS